MIHTRERIAVGVAQQQLHTMQKHLAMPRGASHRVTSQCKRAATMHVMSELSRAARQRGCLIDRYEHARRLAGVVTDN